MDKTEMARRTMHTTSLEIITLSSSGNMPELLDNDYTYSLWINVLAAQVKNGFLHL